jgi:poly-gamma-glutamate capsule biosynthesis protein CapA/YwtB (metallophosphatase superfamily)
LFKKLSKAFSIILLVYLSGCAATPKPEYIPRIIQEEFQTLTLNFAGDLMAHDINYSRPPYWRVHAALESYLKSDDLSFINLEFPIDGNLPFETYPTFNARPEYIFPAIDAGFDVFSLANNHTTDQGISGIKNTFDSVRYLSSRSRSTFRDIYFSGIREDSGSGFAIETIHRGNLKIGFIAITTFMNSYYGEEYVYLVKQNDEAVKEFTDFLKKEEGKYDLLVVSAHSGAEYVLEPTKWKNTFFRALAEAGADIVMGHHPHVLQKPYFHTRSNGKGPALILPSLGNYISGQVYFLGPDDGSTDRAYTGDSALYQVKLQFSTIGGMIFKEVTPIPFSVWKEEDKTHVIRTFDDLLSMKADDPWRSFYQLRWEAVKPLLFFYRDWSS